jgi:hypothetical protein
MNNSAVVEPRSGAVRFFGTKESPTCDHHPAGHASENVTAIVFVIANWRR